MSKNKIKIINNHFMIINTYAIPYTAESVGLYKTFETLLYSLKLKDEDKVIKDTDIAKEAELLKQEISDEENKLNTYLKLFKIKTDRIEISTLNLKRFEKEIIKIPNVLKNRINGICNLISSRYEDTYKEQIEIFKEHMLASIASMSVIVLRISQILKMYEKSIVERIIQTILMENDT